MKIRESDGGAEKYFTKGNGDHPDNKTEAYKILVNYNISYNIPTILVDNSEEVFFANI